MGLVAQMQTVYPDRLAQRYKLSEQQVTELGPWELVEAIGRARGMLVSGGEVNTERAAITGLDEYRGGKLGRITLARPRRKGRNLCLAERLQFRREIWTGLPGSAGFWNRVWVLCAALMKRGGAPWQGQCVLRR